jgi:hypothetical protein
LKEDDIMDDADRERREGVDWDYLTEGLKEKEALKGEYYTSHVALFGQMFSLMAKTIIDALGRERGEEIIKKAVEDFGEERGRRIAQRVKALGKPLSFRNFLIYTDLDTSAILSYMPKIENGNLLLEIDRCDFSQGARDWGLLEYFNYYCRYVDEAILRGYNPDLKLEVPKNISAGDDICFFKYTIKGDE